MTDTAKDVAGGERLLHDRDVDALLGGVDWRQGIADTLQGVVAGRVEVAPRVRMGAGDRVIHVRVARNSATDALVIKTTDYDPERPVREGRPSVVGSVSFLVDGRLRFIAPAGAFTAHRTATTTTFVLDHIAGPDATVLAVIGAGVQAEAHIRHLAGIRLLDEIRLVSRSKGSHRLAGRLAVDLGGIRTRVFNDVSKACHGADIIVAATTSAEPVLASDDVDPGTAVALIGGGSRRGAEATTDLLARAEAVYSDAVDAALDVAGRGETELSRQAPVSGRFRSIIGLMGSARPVSADGVAVYASTGSAWQDLACGEAVADRLGSSGSASPYFADSHDASRPD